MKNVINISSCFLVIIFSIVLSCKNKEIKNKNIIIYETTINQPIDREFIDSIDFLCYDKKIKIFLNKTYVKNQLFYEIEVINSKKIKNYYVLPYYFISGNDTLQADDIALSNITISHDRKKQKIKNGFIVEFWQSKALFQYIIYFDEKNFYLQTLKRITEQTDLNKEIKVCEVILNDDLKKLSFKKIDSILNSFDEIKNKNCY